MSPDDLKAHLGQLASLSARANRAAVAIRSGAGERLAEVARQMDDLRPRTATDPDAEEAYLALAEEQGQLRRVLQS